jgi:hypothetical protein
VDDARAGVGRRRSRAIGAAVAHNDDLANEISRKFAGQTTDGRLFVEGGDDGADAHDASERNLWPDGDAGLSQGREILGCPEPPATLK